MKSKQIGYLLIAIIALGAVGLAARLLSTEVEEPVMTDVSPLNGDVVDKVVMTEGTASTTLLKIDDGWSVGDYPVYDARLQLMWDTAGRFDGSDLVSTNPENHWLMGTMPEYGTVVQFWSGDSLIEEFYVGDKFSSAVGKRTFSAWSAAVRMCYVRRPGQDEVYGLTCFFPENFTADATKWNDPVIAQIPRDDIQHFVYKYPDEEFEVRPAQGGEWAVVSEDGIEAARSRVISGILGLMERMLASGFPTEAEKIELDFSEPDAVVSIVTKPDSETQPVQLLFVEKDELEYFVKDASKSYAYVVETDAVFDLLSSRHRFTTELDPASVFIPGPGRVPPPVPSPQPATSTAP